MKTSRDISTVSYNTKNFLLLKLKELVDAKKISFWFLMEHKPEKDELKGHFHLFIRPSKQIQTDDLRDEFKEYDPEMPKKPRCVMPFDYSDFANAYLYFLHDPAYLASKGQSRKYHYKVEEFLTSEPDYLALCAKDINPLILTPYYAMQEAQRSGMTFAEFFARGSIPILQVALYQRAWDLLFNADIFRNGRQGHELECDKNTGEVIENE